MQRNALKDLIVWKDSAGRKPLIISGARQVGKTWLMKEFGKNCFSKTVYINFDENRTIAKSFDGNIDPKSIMQVLNIETGVSVDAETLVIFDEIQECPRALSSLKYFCEEAPEIPVIAAGSLLGVALHQGTSFPVGKVDFLNLYPMTFPEFLVAVGDEKLAEMLDNPLDSVMKNKNSDKENEDSDKENKNSNKENNDSEKIVGNACLKLNMIAAFKDRLIMRLKQYYFVGGMPEAVLSFSQSGDFDKVREIQKNLINYYRQDFSKHAQGFPAISGTFSARSSSLIPRLNLVWDSIPLQLSKENKKFFYGQIKEGARAKDFEMAIQWLSDCGLIIKTHCVKKPGMPLNAYVDFSAFKIYLHDVGLLCAMSDLSAKTIIDGNNIFTEFKGALTEQFVCQQLTACTEKTLYYHAAENSRCEIDFLVQEESEIVPVEVKAEENLQAKSLKSYYKKYQPEISVRTSLSDFRKQDWLINIPLYCICDFENIIRNFREITENRNRKI